MIKYAKIKRVLSGLLSMSLLSLFFIGISGVGVESKTTLSVMLGEWWKDQAPIIKEKYEQTHPDVELNFRLMGFSVMHDGLIAELVTHRAADVFAVQSSWWLPGLVDKGLLASWDEYVGPDKPIKPEWFAPMTLEGLHLQGNQWGIPFRASTLVLLYNRNMFKEAGLNPDAYPTSLIELKEYARILTNPEKGIYGFVWDGGSDAHLEHYIQQFLWNFGADFMNKEGTEAAINSPPAVTAVDFMASFLKEGLVPKVSVGLPSDDDIRFFGARQAATVLAYDGGHHIVREVWPDVNWDEDIGKAVLEHPVVAVTALSMQRNPNQPEESARFVGWFIENLSELTIRIPSTLRQGDYTIKNPESKPWLEQIAVAKESANLIPELSEILFVTRKQVQRVCLGEASAKEAMDIAAEEMNKILSQ